MTNYFKFLFFLFFTLLKFNFELKAQTDISKTITKIFDNIKFNKFEQIDTKALLKKENHRVAWSQLIPYYSDTSAKVRDKAYRLTTSIANVSQDQELRKSVVNYLLIGCRDKDQSVVKTCGKLLESFEIKDFNDKAKASLLELLQNSKIDIGHTSQLAAFVRVENLEAILLPLLEDKIPNKEKWQIRLSLARIGHTPSITYVLDKVKSLPLNDDLIIEAFPALAYTRNKECFDYMITVVQSDRKDCTSAHPDSEEQIICGFRTLEYITPFINDFPLKLQASGDLAGDYNKALNTARNWFREKGINYTLNSNTF